MTDVVKPLLEPSGPALVPRRRKYYRQHLVSLLANISVICNGVVLGWSSPAEATLKPSMSSAAWVWTSAIAPLGAVVGALPAGVLADVIGRRDALLTSALPSLLGWFLITFLSSHVWATMLGRCLVGVAMGASTVIVPLYSDETASELIRGIVGVYLDMSLTIGILIAYVIGGLWSYEALNVFGCILPLVFASTFVWMPETPRHLRAKGRIYEAEEVYGWLRGKNFTVTESAERALRHASRTAAAAAAAAAESAPTDESSKSHRDTSSKETPSAWKSRASGAVESTTSSSVKIVRSGSRSRASAAGGGGGGVVPDAPGAPPQEDADLRPWPKNATIRGITIVFLLMVFEQMSGICGIIFYAERIFQESSSSLKASTAALMIGVVEVLAAMASAALVDRLGRRPLLGVSAGMMAASLVSLASCFWLAPTSTVNDWLPVLSLCIYIIFFSVGFGPLPWFMMAELLPPQTKRWAAPAAVAINWIFVFTVTVGFEPALETFGQQATYFGLAVICAVALIFVLAFVPETIKLSPEQIRIMVIQGRLYYKAPKVERTPHSNGVRETTRL